MSTLYDLQNALRSALEATQRLSSAMVNGITKAAHENAPKGSSVTLQPTSDGVVVKMGRAPGNRPATPKIADRAADRLSGAAEKVAQEIVGDVWR